MDTGLIFLGTEQAVEHVPGRPEHVLDGDPLTNVWRNVTHPSGKMHAGDARRDNSASSGMITSTKTELQIPQ